MWSNRQRISSARNGNRHTLFTDDVRENYETSGETPWKGWRELQADVTSFSCEKDLVAACVAVDTEWFTNIADISGTQNQGHAAGVPHPDTGRVACTWGHAAEYNLIVGFRTDRVCHFDVLQTAQIVESCQGIDQTVSIGIVCPK